MMIRLYNTMVNPNYVMIKQIGLEFLYNNIIVTVKPHINIIMKQHIIFMKPHNVMIKHTRCNYYYDGIT